MKISEFKDKKILVLGLGKEGQSAFNFLKKHFPENEVAVTDQKDGPDYLKNLMDYDVIVKSPGIPFLPEIVKAKENGKIITSNTEIFFNNFKGQVIGVTGTKGKSTTTSLIYEVLKSGGKSVKLIGNIGNPALDILDELSSETLVVYELSSFQLTGLTKSPHIAVWTNIYPEHLDYHQSFEAYLESKANITKYQNTEDYFIFNSDIPELVQISKKTKAQVIPFSKDSKSILRNLETSLIGDFNLLNIIPAVIIGKLLDISESQIASAIKNFKPLPHRLEFVAKKNGIEFYNDSLATNPRATIAAIEAFGDQLETLIAGGYDRGIDYSVLGPVIAKSNIKNLILFPDTGERIWEAVLESGKSQESGVQKYDVDSMEEAIKKAYELTRQGKICLLSPASASFNMFKDYADRGEKFKKLVLSY